MTRYDSSILQQYADALDSREFGLIVSHALIGAAVGAVALYFLQPFIAPLLRLPPGADLFSLSLFGAGVGAALGGMWGNGKGLALKLQAQVALCLMKVEQNTSCLEQIERNTNHLVGIEQNTIRLERIELDTSQSEDKVAAASFGR